MNINITTKNNTNYTIDDDGCFIHYNQHKFTHPHDSWKCNGIAERLAFNNFRYYSFKTFITMIKNNQIKTFKNGTARFYIRDIDHGTERLHMDGIEKVWLN